MKTHPRDRLIRFEAKGSPEIQIPDGREAISPVHMSDDVSPCGREVVGVFNILEDGQVRGRTPQAQRWERTPVMAPT